MKLTAPKAALNARDYVANLPPAVAGAHGSDVTFHAACALVRFGLADAEAMALLRDYSQRCDPPWSERELQHKLDNARRKAGGCQPARRTAHQAKPAERIVWHVTRKTPPAPVKPTTPPEPTPPPKNWEVKPGAIVPTKPRFTTQDLTDALKDWQPCDCHKCEALRNPKL